MSLNMKTNVLNSPITWQSTIQAPVRCSFFTISWRSTTHWPCVILLALKFQSLSCATSTACDHLGLWLVTAVMCQLLVKERSARKNFKGPHTLSRYWHFLPDPKASNRGIRWKVPRSGPFRCVVLRALVQSLQIVCPIGRPRFHTGVWRPLLWGSSGCWRGESCLFCCLMPLVQLLIF